MANATTLLAGDIQLAGDLTGTATSPSLISTGVTPGVYTTANLTIDSKGRVTYAENGTVSLPTATTSTMGILQVTNGNGLTISSGVLSYTQPIATASVLGSVKIGTGINVTVDGIISSTASIPTATTSTKGILQVTNGNGLDLTGGVLSYTQPIATASTLGLVKIGNGINIAGDGTITIQTNPTLPDATYTSKGIVQISSTYGLTVTSGVLSAGQATSSTYGVVKIGSGLLASSGVVSLDTTQVVPITTTGGIKYITGLNIKSNGLITYTNATVSTTGSPFTYTLVNNCTTITVNSTITSSTISFPTGYPYGQYMFIFIATSAYNFTFPSTWRIDGTLGKTVALNSGTKLLVTGCSTNQSVPFVGTSYVV